MSESEIKEHLYEGLRPSIRTALYGFAPTTVSEFLKHARRIEKGLQSTGDSNPIFSELESLIKELQHTLVAKNQYREPQRAYNTVSEPPSAALSNICCFRCKQIGHYSPECQNISHGVQNGQQSHPQEGQTARGSYQPRPSRSYP